MKYLGDYADDSTVRIFFSTNDAAGGAVAPSTAFEAADVRIYKNNSATQKATTNGVTMSSPFDSVTGLHLIEIDCSNDTGDAGFWSTGNDYSVVLSPDETVDSQTVVAAIAQFSIENRIVSAVSGNVAGIAGTLQTLDALDTAQDSQHATTQSAISALNNFDPAADTVANVSTVASVSGSVGSISGVTFPTNFSDLAITATTGRVTVGTNADKTGYSLSQSFPANFADLSITASTGRVSTGTNYDKTGYSLSQAFPTNFADLSISATTGRVDVGSMAADTITASAIAADAVTELQNGVATSAALSSAAAEISAILADTGTDGVVISSATANAIADAILSRNVSNTEATAAEHTLTTIVLAILESARTTTDWNIYRTNGVSVHATKSISTDAAALPVTGVS